MLDKQMEIIGVIGGMGPAATSRFFRLLINQTPAEKDQDHVRILIDNNPAVPDRTDHLVNEGKTPLPVLIEMVDGLEQSGADLLTMPCNTAHAYFDDLNDASTVPMINMIELVVDHVSQTVNGSRVGLLATDGTRKAGVYESAAEDTPITLVKPVNRKQNMVMDAIYGDRGIKAGYEHPPRKKLRNVANSFEDVDAIIAGCTEIPLALQDQNLGVPLFDPMAIMAKRAIEIVTKY